MRNACFHYGGILSSFGINSIAVYCVINVINFQKKYCNTAELILFDIRLDDGSGFSLCKQLRETTKMPILYYFGKNKRRR